MQSTEIWKPIPGYEGMYEASTFGRIRSWNGRWQGSEPRVLKPTPIPSGYLSVVLYRHGSRQTKLVHRIVAETFAARGGHNLVRHLDGDKLNNRAPNLAWGTVSENAVDSVSHGTNANTRKTHCAQGHEYTDENTYRFKGSGRVCRLCSIERAKNNYRAKVARKKGES